MSAFYTDNQIERLILALVGQHKAGVTQARIEAWIDWCETQALRAELVQMVLRSELVPSWPDGEAEPQFTASELQ